VGHLVDNNVEKGAPVQFGEQLKIDPSQESIVGNDKAAALLTREYRKPFVVPAAGEV